MSFNKSSKSLNDNSKSFDNSKRFDKPVYKKHNSLSNNSLSDNSPSDNFVNNNNKVLSEITVYKKLEQWEKIRIVFYELRDKNRVLLSEYLIMKAKDISKYKQRIQDLTHIEEQINTVEEKHINTVEESHYSQDSDYSQHFEQSQQSQHSQNSQHSQDLDNVHNSQQSNAYNNEEVFVYRCIKCGVDLNGSLSQLCGKTKCFNNSQ